MGQKKASWILVFEDEFSGDKLDESKWFYNDLRGKFSKDNSNYGLNLQEGARVENGNLYLMANKSTSFFSNIVAEDHFICNEADDHYSQLDSVAKASCRNGVRGICDSFPELCANIILADGGKNRREFLYKQQELISHKSFRFGKFEMRFKLFNSPYKSKKSRGHWPAFWLFGWDNEIDIFEIDNTDKKNYKPNHWVYREDANYGVNYIKDRKTVLNTDDDEFHTVGVEWYPPGVYGEDDVIIWYIDGRAFFSSKFKNGKAKGKSLEGDVDPRSMNLILTVFVDHWRGASKRAWNGPPDSKTKWPYGMIIDYVKVWQYTEFEDECNPDFIEESCENLWYFNNIGTQHSWYDELSDGLLLSNNISFGSAGSGGCDSWEDGITVLRNSVSPPDVNKEEIYYLSPISNSLDLRACNKIVLKPSQFAVKEGAQFTAKIIENPIDCSDGSIQAMQLEGSIYYGAQFCADSSNPLRFRYNCADSYKATVFDPGHNLAVIHEENGFVDEYGLVYPWSGEGGDLTSGLYYLTIEVTNANETKTYQYNIDARFYNCNLVVTKFEVSPNPFTEMITVNFELDRSTDVQLAVIDAQGRMLLEQKYKGRPAGIYEEKLDLGQLPPGVYFCYINTAEDVNVRKLVKM